MRAHSPLGLLLAAAIAAFPRVAAAEEKKEEEERPKTAYLSFSPVHLTRPIFEMTGEMALSRKWSVSVTAGAGTIYRQAYWNAGMQLLAYPVGNFERGLQLGVETNTRASLEACRRTRSPASSTRRRLRRSSASSGRSRRSPSAPRPE